MRLTRLSRRKALILFESIKNCGSFRGTHLEINEFAASRSKAQWHDKPCCIKAATPSDSIGPLGSIAASQSMIKVERGHRSLKSPTLPLFDT
jgi:hypothetical protein